MATVRLDHKGRGRALRQVWSRSDADVVAYTDVELSTDLAALLPLLAPLVAGHSDLAIGTRLHRGPPGSCVAPSGGRSPAATTCCCRRRWGRVQRRPVRVQGAAADAARALLPLVQDRIWCFDTELLVLAERAGLRIHEVPVDWVDDPDSRVAIVAIVAAALEDLRSVGRLAGGLLTGSLGARLVAAAAPGSKAWPSVPSCTTPRPGRAANCEPATRPRPTHQGGPTVTKPIGGTPRRHRWGELWQAQWPSRPHRPRGRTFMIPRAGGEA